ncbi:MAG TPA: ABC transporter permease subunit [Thermoanaerobaculia bacterium]|nr:ABC transporter permease subunit [Thermoanaerobaculia bacterium]
MRPRIVALLAARELRASMRGRWFLVGAISFGLLAVAVARLGMEGAQQWGVNGLDRAAAALLNLVLLFVPLLTLPLGASSFAGEAEDGVLSYLIAQPLTRAEAFGGKLAGLLVSMSLALLIGFGVAAVWIGLGGGVSPVAFGALACGAWLLGLVTTAIGVLIAVVARNRARALAGAVGVWLTLVFLCDFGVLALAAAQALGPGALFGITVANPLQAAKTLSALAMSERLEILGPVGVYAVRELGRLGLAAVLAATLAGWTALAAGWAFAIFRKESLT